MQLDTDKIDQAVLALLALGRHEAERIQEKPGVPVLTSLTTSRATHSPPSKRNIVRWTPGKSFTSSTEAEVTQPLSKVSVFTSDHQFSGVLPLALFVREVLQLSE
jgi:hypothetical protein